MFKFYLNDTLLSQEPEGMDDFVEVLERDESIRGLLFKYPLKLTFWGDGYNVLNDAYEADGYCPTITIRIEQDGAEIFRGLIFLTDTTFNLNKRSAECSIEDDNFGSRVFNNKKQKAKLDVDKSKNGIDITPCAEFELQLFDNATGVYDVVNTVRAFNYKEVFRFLIDYMTDGQMDFESNFLDNLEDGKNLCICRGIELRSTGNNAPAISFEEAFVELNKKYNIGFIIKRVDGRPVMQIEQEVDLYGDAVITIANIQDLERSFDSEKLYSVIEVGSTNYVDLDTSLPPIDLVTFREESYNVSGECNIDKKLDLVSDWVIDTNTIEDVYSNSTEDFDDNIFIIQFNESTNKATASNYYSSGSIYLYNEELLNRNVVVRWSVQGDIFKYLLKDDASFKAVEPVENSLVLSGTGGASTSSSIAQIRFRDDYSLGNDVNNNYGNGTTQGTDVSTANSRFTAPSTDYYTFECAFAFNTTATGTSYPPTTSAVYNMAVDHKNSGGTLLNTLYTGVHSLNVADPYTGLGGYTFPTPFVFTLYMNTGDYILMRIGYTVEGGGSYNCTIKLMAGHFLRGLSAISEGGGVVSPSSSNSYYVSKFLFNKGLSLTDWNIIKGDLSKGIQFNHDGITNRNGWIRKVSRNIKTSETDFELISNFRNGN